MLAEPETLCSLALVFWVDQTSASRTAAWASIRPAPKSWLTVRPPPFQSPAPLVCQDALPGRNCGRCRPGSPGRRASRDWVGFQHQGHDAADEGRGSRSAVEAGGVVGAVCSRPILCGRWWRSSRRGAARRGDHHRRALGAVGGDVAVLFGGGDRYGVPTVLEIVQIDVVAIERGCCRPTARKRCPGRRGRCCRRFPARRLHRPGRRC